MENRQSYIDEIERLRADNAILIETNMNLSSMIESGAPATGQQQITKAIDHLKREIELAKSTLDFALFTFNEYLKHPELLQDERESNVVRMIPTASKP